MNNKMRMVSGIKPSGSTLTLGNYLGAIKPFVKYQDTYELFVFIADLHALTIFINPNELRANTTNLIKTYIAAGLDPQKCTIFKQSSIPAHNQLEWILTCNTQVPELTKMPQFKNFQERHKGESVPAGVLLYPSLMNADILLYGADYVPVGFDQKPHVDLTRDIALQFNKIYGETFKLPKAVIAETGAKIMSLSDPTKKMSKSESDRGTIYLNDSPEIIRKKIMKAKTDAESKIYFDPETKPGISNLLTIYAAIRDITIDEAAETFKNETDYGKFKSAIADAVIADLEALQERMTNIKVDDNTLLVGAETAKQIANNTIKSVYTKVGLI